MTSREADAEADLGGSREQPFEKDVEELTRPSDNLLLRWLILEGDRLHVTAVIQIVILLSLLVVGSIWEFELLDLATEQQAIQDLFNTLLGGVILLVSVVVSINSIVLTQEVTSLGSQHEEIQSSREYRRDLEAYSESGVPPVTPGAFLEYVLVTVHDEAEQLRAAVADTRNSDVRAEVEEFLADVDEQIEQVHYTLATANGKVSNVLLAGINYEYSRQITAARRLLRAHGEDLSEEECERVEDVVDALAYFGTTREYLKTLYLKNELATFSVHLLYVALPVIVFTSYVLLAVSAGVFPPRLVPGIPRLLVVIGVAYAIVLTPFTLLTAYVIRVASVSRRSLATGPFLLEGDEEWEAESVGEPGRETAEEREQEAVEK